MVLEAFLSCVFSSSLMMRLIKFPYTELSLLLMGETQMQHIIVEGGPENYGGGIGHLRDE